MEMAYVIQDSEGCFVKDDCFIKDKDNNEWNYVYFTGKTSGFTYYLLKDVAEKVMVTIQGISDKHNFQKKFHILFLDINSIPMGEICIRAL